MRVLGALGAALGAVAPAVGAPRLMAPLPSGALRSPAGLAARQEPAQEPLPPTGRLRAILDQGLDHARAGELRAAIERFDVAIETDPECAEAFDWRGWCRAKLGEPAAAIEDFSRSIEIAPANPWPRMARAQSWLDLNELPSAARDYLEVLRIDPEHLEAHARLGFLLGATTGDLAALEHLDYVLARGGAERASEALWRWILARENGLDRDQTDRALAAWLDASGDRIEQTWERALARYDLGTLGRDELFTLAAVRDAVWAADAPPPATRIAQAAFHAAVRAQAEGATKEALVEHHRALETFARGTWEWEGARVRLRRLAKRHRLEPYLGLRTTEPDASFAAMARIDARACRAVEAVDPKSFAGRAGIEAGDVILSIDGEPASAEAFGARVDAAVPGDLLRLELLRGSRRSRCALLVDVRLE